MISGDDIALWNLLSSATATRIEGDLVSGTVTIWIDIAEVGVPSSEWTLLGLRLTGCTQIFYRPRNADSIADLAEIAAHRPTIVEAQRDRGDVLVWCRAGSLRLHCERIALELENGAPIEIGELRRVVQAYWDQWSALPPVHPAIAEILDRRTSLEDMLPRLLALWRHERTSELAKAIACLDGRKRRAPPAVLDGPESVDRWCATWTESPSAALGELARRTQACWHELMASHADGSYASSQPKREALWAGLAQCLGALRAAEPDPRIGRGVEESLESPGEYWFRVDQVRHVFAQPNKPHDGSSFADHALALIEHHGDAGTPVRLDDFANRILREASCNEVEMAERLDGVADRLVARYPVDRTLADELAAALRNRS